MWPIFSRSSTNLVSTNHDSSWLIITHTNRKWVCVNFQPQLFNNIDALFTKVHLVSAVFSGWINKPAFTASGPFTKLFSACIAGISADCLPETLYARFKSQNFNYYFVFLCKRNNIAVMPASHAVLTLNNKQWHILEKKSVSIKKKVKSNEKEI